FDTLASHQGAPRLMEAIGRRDPRAGLREFVALIAGFWETDRVVVSRLQGLAALDADFGRVWSRREALRRQGLGRLAQRVAARSSRISADRLEGVVDALYALVSFETFRAMAGEERPLTQAVPMVQALALAAFRAAAEATR